MDTQEKNEKAKPVSKLFLIEKGTWKKGQEVITVAYKPDGGPHIPIGHVYLDYDAENKMLLRSKDSSGNELFPPSANRYELKKFFLDNEQQLIQGIVKGPEQTKSAPAAEVKNETPTEPLAENPETKGEDLTKVRRKKDDKDKPQSITH